VCEYAGWPGYKWSSSSDDTDAFPGIVCSRLESPLPGSSLQDFSDWWKVAKLIVELP
jgi:hypothetical protein